MSEFQVYENLLLSPGKNTYSFITKITKKRKHQNSIKSSVELKKRRRELKSSTNKQVLILNSKNFFKTMIY